MGAAVYRAEELAQLAGISTWLLYKLIREEDCPFPFIKVGRRVLFPSGPNNRLLGIGTDPGSEASLEAPQR